MKRSSVFCLSFLFCLISAWAESASWESVKKAMNAGKPKTAIAQLDELYANALKIGDIGDAAKAITRKISLEGTIQGNKPEERITRLDKYIPTARKEMQPILKALQAHWIQHFFKRNRWRFSQRTRTAEAPGKDMLTWDLPRILAEVDHRFQQALSHKEDLKKLPIQTFSKFLTPGKLDDAYRPTLYDFVAHEALSFYNSGEQAGAKAQDEFVLNADSPIFADKKSFLAWKPNAPETPSPLLRAIALYQELLRFHKEDLDPRAYADVDLARLRFGKNHAKGSAKTERYRSSLKTYIKTWKAHEMTSMGLYELARLTNEDGEKVRAHDIASQGKAAFPESRGGRLCHNLIAQIEAPSLTTNTERTWTNPWPTLDVRYRNLEEVFFRAIPHDLIGDLAKKNNNYHNPEQIDWRKRKELVNMEAAHSWSAKLPPTLDYKERIESLPTPQNLKPGFYYILSSAKNDFSEKNNQLSYASVWVSELALVTRYHSHEKTLEGLLTMAKSGEPVTAAFATAWAPDNKVNRLVKRQRVRTNEKGIFRIENLKQSWGYRVHIQKGEHELFSRHQQSVYGNSPWRTHERVVFFTDRALYRPGQTIHVKGILYRHNQKDDAYDVVPNKSVTISFRDANHQEVKSLRMQTNDYGSFSTTLTAPSDRLTGAYTIQAGGRGSTRLRIEEYKRPKFQVEISPPEEPAVLERPVTVKGTATAYTGASIGGASVKFRVVRSVRYPTWRSWVCWWPVSYGQSAEIAHGTTTTDADGTYDITFIAKPDEDVPEEDEPTFIYKIIADVTDTNGETRSSSRQIRVSARALKATVNTASWLEAENPIQFKIKTTSLDGEARSANGSLNVYQLQQPKTVVRQSYTQPLQHSNDQSKTNWANPRTWPLGAKITSLEFESDQKGSAVLEHKLPAGIYRVILESRDSFGKAIRAIHQFEVLNPLSKSFAINKADHLSAPSWSLEPGDEFTALWGTGYAEGRALVEIECKGRILQQYWTNPEQTQIIIRQNIDEDMRGGFTLRVTSIKENRAFMNKRTVNVPWTNKQLQLSWERFTSKLEPGSEETWTAIIKGPKAQAAAAEMVATLYDASLDQYYAHHWIKRFPNFRQERSFLNSRFEGGQSSFQNYHHGFRPKMVGVGTPYRMFPHELTNSLWGYGWGYQSYHRQELSKSKGGQRMMRANSLGGGAVAEMEESADMLVMDASSAPMSSTLSLSGTANGPVQVRARKPEALKKERKDDRARANEPEPDLDAVEARTNLNETAFFMPHLRSDEDGSVKLSFTMPEALTEWHFMGFAHDQKLRAGFLEGTTRTAKDLMVEPNPPRFLREGDELAFTVKVTNMSNTIQHGKVRLNFSDARTLDSVEKALGINVLEQSFELASMSSNTFSWTIKVPDGMETLIYKAVGATSKLSDGEEGFLPVLSRRIVVREALPLPIRGEGQKEFSFDRLLESGKSDSLQHQSLTLQMVSNPTWYAVMALPYLMEYPHMCSEQIFNRLYANTLASHIANSQPKIRRIFDQWKGTDALDSPLEKNEELKGLALTSTPWVRQAQNESQARRNVGILFDKNHMKDQMSRLMHQLGQSQRSDGAWPWFPGGRPNDYITLYIVTGFGRMSHLGVKLDMKLAHKALPRLDNWMLDRYEYLKSKDRLGNNNLTTTIAFHLYGRSFFLKGRPLKGNHQVAFDYFLEQAKEHWLKLGHRQSQAHLALALHRTDHKKSAMAIMESIAERSVEDEELGMFWRDLEFSWWWYRAPIETQAMMIEAFDEVMGDENAVEACKVWLLKQKQTQDWKTTKATADAVYALLLRGTDGLASDALVEVKLGGKVVEAEKVEAGTGFYEKRFTRSEVMPEQGQVTVTKTDKGVAWGSLHWQYMEDMSKVTSYEGTPLKLTKRLYHRIYTKQGPTLEAVKGPLGVGDEVVVRLELRTDRDMEYVHLEDQRGSGTEPVDVLSTYRYQDGLAYYMSTKDTGTHFFIDYMPKGVYVFEYALRVVHKGSYQTGMAKIQCMYAPEFGGHSESHSLKVK